MASSLEDKTAGPGDADEEDDGGGDGGEVSSNGSVNVFSSSPDDLLLGGFRRYGNESRERERQREIR